MALGCTRSNFISEGACFTAPSFTPLQQQAILVYRLAQLYQSAGGVAGYTDAATLWAAANDATCGMTDDQLRAAMIAVLNADPGSGFVIVLGGVTSMTRAEAADVIKCFEKYTESQLKKMEIFMWCAFFGTAQIP